MDSRDIRHLLNLTLDSFDTSSDSPHDFDEYLEKLRFFFSETLVLAALDLVDRENVIRISTAWGYSHFQVLGSTATYTVFPGASASAEMQDASPAFCTCPAYAYSVLLSGSELMCKHVLAAAISLRISACVERNVKKNDLADVAIRQCS